MPTNALTNPLVLPILGLLLEGPKHGYAVFRELCDRYEHVAVRNSTVYTLLDRLVDAEWIAVSAESKPPQFVMTDAGSRALADGVVRQIREAPIGPSEAFTTAVAYLGIFPPGEAGALLRERHARTCRDLERIDTVLTGEPVRELHILEMHYLRSALQHDAHWLEQTAQRIDTGDLAWPTVPR